jgi:hypothetical protein
VALAPLLLCEISTKCAFLIIAIGGSPSWVRALYGLGSLNRIIIKDLINDPVARYYPRNNSFANADDLILRAQLVEEFQSLQRAITEVIMIALKMSGSPEDADK